MDVQIFDTFSLKVHLGGDLFPPIDTGINLHTGNWNHLSVVWSSGFGNITVYVNATKVFGVDGFMRGYQIPRVGQLVMGGDRRCIRGGRCKCKAVCAHSYSGTLDEVRVFHKSRDSLDLYLDMFIAFNRLNLLKVPRRLPPASTTLRVMRSSNLHRNCCSPTRDTLVRCLTSAGGHFASPAALHVR